MTTLGSGRSGRGKGVEVTTPGGMGVEVTPSRSESFILLVSDWLFSSRGSANWNVGELYYNMNLIAAPERLVK